MIRWIPLAAMGPARALRAGMATATVAAALAGCTAGPAAAATTPASPSPPSVLVSDAFPGASVNAVRPGSAAARAGLSTGDVVTAVDGKPLGTARELLQYLGRLPAGKSARLTVVHANGSTTAISITLRVLSG
jgi:S1-C subfamily serine protease